MGGSPKSARKHAELDSAVAAALPAGELLHVFRQPGMLVLLAVHSSNNFANFTLMSWGPSYFSEVLGAPLESVGLYMMLHVASMALGQVLGGMALDWTASCSASPRSSLAPPTPSTTL